MTATKPLPPHGTTDATGTRRRVQALHHDGYSTRRIASATRRPVSAVTAWLHNNRSVSVHDAAAVARVYDRWAGTDAEDNGVRPEEAENARALARHRRWFPPSSWASTNIDDPAATPVRIRTKRSSEELVAMAEQVRATTTYTWPQIAAHLGVTYRALDRARTRVAARRKACGAKSAEHLPHVRGGSSIGLDLNTGLGPSVDLPPQTIDRAMQVVAGRAVDTADARLLLDVLGLIDLSQPHRRLRKGVPA